jgi:hypothetical protein
MPQAGFEPAPARFLRPPPLAVGLLRHRRLAASAPGRSRTCTDVDLNHAPRAVGLPERFSLQWTLEGVEPSSPGCKPGALPLDDRPIRARRSSSAAGRTRTFILGLRRAVLIRLSYRNELVSGPHRIRTCTGALLRRLPLPSWATGPLVSMHRAGIEPATLRLKAGGSAS